MGKAQILAIAGAFVFLAWIVELIRARRLKEQYALLWLGAGLTLLGFALKRNLIDRFGALVGIAYSPTAVLFVVVLLLMGILLHFSTVISTLMERTTRLAQELALVRGERPPSSQRAADEDAIEGPK